MELTKIIRAIGSFTIALFVVTVPLLCGLSYVLKFNSFFQWILTIITIIILLVCAGTIYENSEE